MAGGDQGRAAPAPGAAAGDTPEVYEALAGEPERAAALDRALLEFATAADGGAPGGPAELAYEYLLVVARKR
jgi:hypothetical protein